MANKTKAELEAQIQMLQQSQQVQPTKQVGFWAALNSIFGAVFTLANAAQRGAEVVDDTLALAQREVTVIGVHQDIRLDRIKHEQDIARVELANKLAKA